MNCTTENILCKTLYFLNDSRVFSIELKTDSEKTEPLFIGSNFNET